MCENGCVGCNGGEDKGIDTQLLMEFNKIVGYLTMLTDKVDALEKKQDKLQKKFRKFIRGEDTDLSEGLMDSLEDAFVTDFLEKFFTISEDEAKENTAKGTSKVTLTKGATEVKESDGNPVSVKVTVTKKKDSDNFFTVAEYLDSVGVLLTNDKFNIFKHIMKGYVTNSSDVKSLPGGVVKYSRKALYEGLRQFLDKFNPD